MKPTMEILEKINQNSQKNKDEVFTRLYRYMLRDDIYYVAYKNLYANKGAGTKGVDHDTADGFSEKYVNKIIEKLSDGSYQPKPVRRTYIKKTSRKLRPLGIPTFSDKLVQEVLRMILEAIYEPIFFEVSHGFRPNRGCHTVLSTIKKEFNGTQWFIEGDIKGCFDNINHTRLIEIIGTKIKDARLIQLIYKFLKAGYMEDWKYNNTYSGCPQGHIASPILTNIYLHELDKFVMGLKDDFDKPADQKYTEEYNKIRRHVEILSRKIGKASEAEKPALLQQWKEARTIMLKTPSKLQTDKKLKYIRYADDFIVAVNGSKEDCEQIKAQLKEFLGENLKMELSDEKTYITHSNTPARFLGYNIKIRRSNVIKPTAQGMTKRTMNYKTELTIPLKDKIEKFLFDHKVVEIRNCELSPCKRSALICLTDVEIVDSYNAEIRGICNYYTLASNYSMLSYFSYLMEYSCLKTLAAKHKTTISSIKERYKDGHGNWGIPYENKSGKKKMMYLTSYSKCKNNVIIKDSIVNTTMYHQHTTTTFESRLKKKVCELCGSSDSAEYEIHHVNKVKNLKGKELWEKIMIAKNRKTMVLCRDCHKNIHGKKNFG